MLQREVAPSRHPILRTSILVVAGVAGVGAGIAVRAQRPAPVPVVVVHQPAPVVIVQAAPPVVLAAPAPPPAASRACPTSVALVGIPFDSPHPATHERHLVGAAADPDGCVLATWSAEHLWVSWDGGQTFAPELEGPGPIAGVAIARGRVVVVRGDKLLGVAGAAGSAAWRPLDAGRGGRTVRVLAAGPRIGVLIQSDATAGMAITDDDGATWRVLSPPH
jgi:hypothetical protein